MHGFLCNLEAGDVSCLARERRGKKEGEEPIEKKEKEKAPPKEGGEQSDTSAKLFKGRPLARQESSPASKSMWIKCILL